MHITGGQAKGLRIDAPPGNQTRPTSDRVRESVFGILRDLLPGAEVLDLFAGSGALGLEAASRGARRVTWIEKHPAACRLITANAARLPPAGVTVETAVRTSEVLSWLRHPDCGSVDLIFADPPYDMMREPSGLALFLDRVHQSGLLREDGLLILEVGKRTRPELSGNWSLLRHETYGTTKVLFLDLSGGGS